AYTILTARCDGSGKVHAQTNPRNGPVFALDLQIDITAGTTVTGTVSGTGWSVPVRCTRAVFSKQHPPPLADRYTVTLSDGSDVADVPFGKGLLAITVQNTGNVTVKGALDDATVVTNSRTISISADGAYALYNSIKKTNGANQAYNDM